jgi:hypothetical protein
MQIGSECGSCGQTTLHQEYLRLWYISIFRRLENLHSQRFVRKRLRAEPSSQKPFIMINACQAFTSKRRSTPRHPCKMSTQIDPFLRGWRTLSDELKLLILPHTLPCDEVLRSSDFGKLRPIPKPKPRRLAYRNYKLFLPLLSIPETAGLVNEVLYKQNTVFLSIEDTLHPPQHTRHHVHKIRAMVYCLNSRTLGNLRKFVQSTITYTGLIHLSFEVDCCGQGFRFPENIEATDKIHFRTQVLNVKCYALL